MAPTPRQVTLFAELLDRKQFPANTNRDQVREQFDALSRKSASEWIDKALTLPNTSDAPDTGADAPPPF